jgi:hypothetical protein
VGLGTADELLGQVLVRGNLLLTEVVDEGLAPVHIDHHDLLASRGMCWISGRWRRLRDRWSVMLMDEDTRWYLSASRTKLRRDVRCNVVVADDVVELETVEFVLELVDFYAVGVHVLLVAIPRLVDLVDHHCGVVVD